MIAAWLAAALAAGVSCGLLGVYLVALDMPFLGVAMAHAALAGAVVASGCGLPPWLLALAAALAAGLLLGRLAHSPARANLSALSSILLSVSMGVAFLGIGLARGERAPLLGLLWGNILFVRSSEAALLVLATLGFGGFLFWSGPLLDAFVFAKRPDTYPFDTRPVFAVFMVFAALLISANLQFVGGLLIYALLTNPAAAAFELGETMPAVRRWAVTFGVASALGGLGLSWLADLPTGACVVLLSAACYAAALVVRATRSRGRGARARDAAP